MRYFAQEERLTDLIESVDWDIVVLQEQSQLPGRPNLRNKNMYPYAREINETVTETGAATVLFMTWAYRDGDPFIRDDSFPAMQDRLREGYEILGDEIGAEVAPVGLAWAEASRRYPQMGLWGKGGKYPTLAGSYLTACVFHLLLSDEIDLTKATAFSASSFTAGLPEPNARRLMDVAADVVWAYRRRPATTSN